MASVSMAHWMERCKRTCPSRTKVVISWPGSAVRYRVVSPEGASAGAGERSSFRRRGDFFSLAADAP